jgi:glucose-1-phosphate cytidylyltransferase
MKTVILAGGLGTRISEESYLKPKPMIEIGEYPILVHIMKIYSTYNFKNFIICAGYKQEIIKEYFSNFDAINNDVQFDFKRCTKSFPLTPKIDWNVIVSNTGYSTQTGGRIKRIKQYVGNECFMVTYGDGVGDIDIKALLACHKKSGKIATITVYNFGQSKGVVKVGKNGLVSAFREKSNSDGNLINIGFMVFEPRVFDFISDDDCNLENDVLTKLAEIGELNAYVHKGFWQCMDTLNEKNKLEKMWNSENCPWKVWKE